MATLDKLSTALRNADAAGDTAAAQHLASVIRAQMKADNRAKLEAQLPKADPTGDSAGERFLEGVGAGMSRIGRGIGQVVGLVDQQDVDSAKQTDAALMDTTAGKVGNAAGMLAALAPTVMIPGAATLPGAAAIGAGTGALTTEGSLGERAKAGAIGLAAGPVGVLLGRGLVAGAGAARGLVQPFTQAGQRTLAGNVLREFAGEGADDAAQALGQAVPVLRGVQPTAAELAGNAGIAQLERTLRQNPQLAEQLTQRLQANRAAMTGALDDMAGTEAQMAAAQQARAQAAEPLYAASRASNILPDAEFATLAQRPVMQQAMDRALEIGRNSGQQQTPGGFLHNVKMALDDMLQTGPQRGVGGAEAGAVRDTRAAFVDWLERQSPEYAAGRAAYREASAPINQMQVAGELRDQLVPALGDYGNNTRLTAEKFARSMRNGDATAARATGMPNATLENTMTPQQMATLRQIAEQLARRANADELGRIPGSPTGQNIVSQNVLAQILGPLGLPQSWGQNALSQTIMRPLQWAGRIGEERVLNQLGNALLDPRMAAALLRSANDPYALGSAQANALGRYMALATEAGAHPN